MKCIGIVGISGSGSALCYKYIFEMAAKKKFPAEHPEICIHNFSFSDYFNAGPDEKYDWKGVHDIILQSIEKLKKIGAQFIIIPANTVHFQFEYIKNQSTLPVLNLTEIVLKHCQKRKLSYMLVLGTKLTLQHSLYTFEGSHINSPVLDDSEINLINNYIAQHAMLGKIDKTFKDWVIKTSKKYNVKGILLACTELSGLLSKDDVNIPVVDSTYLLAQAAMEFSYHENKVLENIL